MSTVKDAFAALNETLHPNGFHAAMVPLNMMDYNDLFGGEGSGDAPHHLMTQTYDWRFGGKPDKDKYTVKLSAKDMEYMGRALELYHRVCFDRYEKEMKEVFKNMIAKMDEVFKKENGNANNGDIQPGEQGETDRG